MKRVMSMEAWEYPDNDTAKEHKKIMEQVGYSVGIYCEYDSGITYIEYVMREKNNGK